MSQTDLTPLVQIMARLRDPVDGCAWDRAQDFRSIAPYTIEEAYEVIDAIEQNDLASLRDELGDLLLQVVFHARMAQEAGVFAIDDVIAAICDKMVRRHPHIFDEAQKVSADTVRANWESIKEAERAKGGDASALAGVARALPALTRAEKLQKRAARTGFDWPDVEGPRQKIIEEMEELAEASDDDAREDELGDLLFAAVNLARHMKIDPERALRRANAKFEARFRAMEEKAGDAFTGLSLEEMDALWNGVKADQKRFS